MPGTLDFSVIIVSWNVRKPLQDCLESIFRLPEFEQPRQVFVVDNASTDGTVAMVQQNFPKVTLIANKENKGFASANNQAIAQIPDGAILLLNPDTIVSSGAFPRMLQAFTDHPKAGIVGPKLLNADGTIQPSVRRLPTMLALAAIALKLRHLWPGFPPLARYMGRDLNSEQEQEVGQVMGAAFLIRRKLIDTLGLLDENFHVWFEEVDYCKRAADAGWETWYIPAAHITHIGGQSFSQQPNVQKQVQWFRSVQHYARKHFSTWQRFFLWKCGIIGIGIAWCVGKLQKSLYWLWGIPVAFVFLLGMNTLQVGYLSDDWDWMYEARQTIEQPMRPLISNVGGAFYRPLSTYSFVIDYKIARYNGTISHLYQIILSAISVALFTILIWSFTKNEWLSRTSGMLFALWPTHHEVTTWLSARPDLLCFIFIVAAVLTFDIAVRRSRLWLLVLTVLFATASFLSKENGIIILPVLVLYTFLQHWFRKSYAWLTIIASILTISLFVYIRSIVLGQLVGGYSEAQYSLQWHDITQLFRSVFVGWVNWSWLIAQINSHTAVSIRRVISLLLATGILILIMLQIRQLWQRKKYVAYVLLWGLLLLLPVLPMLDGLDLGTLNGTRFLFLFSGLLSFILAYLLLHSPYRAYVTTFVLCILAIAWFINLQPWRMAGKHVANVREQIVEILPAVDSNTAVYIRGLPGDVYGAYMWYARRSVPEFLVATYGNAKIYQYASMDVSPFCNARGNGEVYVFDWQSKNSALALSLYKKILQENIHHTAPTVSLESLGKGEYIARWDATISVGIFRAIAVHYNNTTKSTGKISFAAGTTPVPSIGKLEIPTQTNGWLRFSLCQSRGWTLNHYPKALHVNTPYGIEINAIKFVDPI